jgi:multicomponent K+:H+ antiporter subunit D
MLPCALLTVAAGFVGVLAARGLRDQAAFAAIGSTGTLLVAASLFEPRSMAAALYYLPHSTFAAALLFLTVDLVERRRGDRGDAISVGPRFAGIEQVSVLYLLAAIALVGMPPLSGFIGKLLILDAAIDHAARGWIWATILVTTLLGIIGFARAGSILFWKSAACDQPAPPAPPHVGMRELLPASALVVLLAVLVAAAGPVTRYMDAVVAQLFAPAAMIGAVLGAGTGG